MNPGGPRYSDAAFVPTTNIRPTIWPDRQITGWKPSYYTGVGTPVAKEGRTTGNTSGHIYSTHVTIPWTPFGTLYHQVLATYYSEGGDSGAPVFSPRSSSSAVLFGIHAGRFGDFAVYSPVEGIQWDLDLRQGS